MFLADNKRTAWIKSRKSLLPYKGLQEYKDYREKALKDSEVHRISLFNSFVVLPGKAIHFGFLFFQRS